MHTHAHTHTYIHTCTHTPHVVIPAVWVAILHEACAGLIQELVTLGAGEACSMPLKVWRHTQRKVIFNWTLATEAEFGHPNMVGFWGG